MAVREVHVPVFELRGGGQQIVGPVGRIGLEVLQHDGEQVLARQAAEHGIPVGRHVGGVGVVDHQRAHRRSADAGVARVQRLAQANHVDGAHGRRHVGTFERPAIEAEISTGRELDPASRTTPVSGHRRKAGDGSHRHATPGVSLQSVVYANERRLCAPELAAELADSIGAYSRDGSRPLRRPLAHALLELVSAQRKTGQIVLVLHRLVEEHVHDGQRQGGVGARANAQPLVALLGGARAHRIDGDHLRAILARLEDKGPEVRIGRERVRSPQQDQVAVRQCLTVGAHRGAHRHHHAYLARRGTDGPVQLGRA